MKSSLRFNPVSREVHRNPYPWYRRLREEEPVHRSLVGTWVVSRYADVQAVLRDARFRSVDSPARFQARNTYLESRGRDLNALAEVSSRFLFFMNPPEHTRLRRLIGRAFTPEFVKAARPDFELLVARLIDGLRGRRHFDLIADFASPFPIGVIGCLLGVPDEDIPRLRQWCTRLARLPDPLVSLDELCDLDDQIRKLRGYFLDLVAARERRAQSDLISRLIAAGQIDSAGYDRDEIASVCVLLLLTGEETSVHMIGNGMLTLIEHPDEFGRLRENPDLIESAVQELLRFESPVQFTTRDAVEDVEIRGVTIRKGERVATYFGSANRDPDVFPDPDRLDITRDARRHLAFGDGIHRCLGAGLATLAGQVAIRALVTGLPKLEIDSPGALRWQRSVAVRGLLVLPVHVREGE